MTLQTHLLAKAANQARGLAIDAVHACSSGHLGLPLGAAEVGAVLFGHALVHNPERPRWINRDRFILSAGHGSMFLYGWLHLSGYDVPLEQVKKFRSLHSITPGHPEFRDTPGVECTTGPLGQGVGNAVGMAMAGQMAAARFNTAEHPIFDYHVVCLAGDGCMQEGVSMEACAFAGHQKLDNLILIYDSNDVTLDAMAVKTQSENAALRFKAIGWDVQTIDGQDLAAFLKAFNKAKKTKSGKPQLIIARTLIAKGIPEVAGTAKGHGEGGAKFADTARAGLGLPADQHFFVSDDVRAYFAQHKQRLIRTCNKWSKTYKAWREANPDKAALLDTSSEAQAPKAAALLEKIPAFPADAKLATRAAGRDVLQPIAAAVPLLIGGSADLYGSTLNYIAADKDFDAGNRAGRNIRFGIREHGMAAIANGVAYDGLFRPSIATFLVFADYSRPAMRLAALSKLPVIYIYTHDSVGVGEDGPTHQPIEHLISLRAIPGLIVMRPGDANEVAEAWKVIMKMQHEPVVLVLSRQNMPTLDRKKYAPVEGVARGAYVLADPPKGARPDLILMATGTEVGLAVDAYEKLTAEGIKARVVSMPSWELFEHQDAQYRNSVLPFDIKARISIEQGSTFGWDRYVGMEGAIIGMKTFGASAPLKELQKKFGFTPEAVMATAHELLREKHL